MSRYVDKREASAKDEMVRLWQTTSDPEIRRVMRRGVHEIERLQNIIRKMRGICETAER